MPFDWREYVGLAERLQDMQPRDNLSKECLLRAALGRAYFGAFCYARDQAEAHLGFAPQSKGTDHVGLREHLKGKCLATTAQRLEVLNEYRNNADYVGRITQIDLKIENDLKVYAGHSLILARRVIKDLQKFY